MLFALATALVAGMLTVLAPCSLSLLPVVLGGSLMPNAGGVSQGAGGVSAGTAGGSAGSAGVGSGSGALTVPDHSRALVVVGSLAASVVLFTLVLKASTALIAVPPAVWRWLSGGLLVALGIGLLAPSLWDRISFATGLSGRGSAALSRASRRGGRRGAVLTGLVLGPVFSSCSPLYGYVVVTVLPSSPVRGVALLLAYVAGLSVVLLAIALLGQRLVARLRFAADPEGPLRRVVGTVFVILGVLILTGLLTRIESGLLDLAPWLPGSFV